MKDCTYYDLLGVPMDATDEELATAKNFLVKKFHPDANIHAGYDTTTYIQNIFDAYHILSDYKRRRIYDNRIRNPIRREDAAASGEHYNGPLSPNFAPYWEAANRLNELVCESQLLLPNKPWKKQEDHSSERLLTLAELTQPPIQTLEGGEIPRQYWFSYPMNWILFQWSQNRDLSYAMLYSMYDSYLLQGKSNLERRKLISRSASFLATLDKLVSYR